MNEFKKQILAMMVVIILGISVFLFTILNIKEEPVGYTLYFPVALGVILVSLIISLYICFKKPKEATK